MTTKKEHFGHAPVVPTNDSAAGTPAQSATHQEPQPAGDVPKDEMKIPHPPVDGLFDCTIIGGGPTGLYAAFYAGMREMSVKIVDSLAELGGQVSALYPEKHIFDVAGFPKILGKDLVAECIEQGLQFGPTVCLGERVEQLERHEDGTFTLVTDRRRHRTKTIIIAAGVGAFTPRKLPDLDHIDVLEGKSLYYFVKSFEPFRQQRVLIVGGGDSAMDWAMALEPIAQSVTLIHRRDRWRAHDSSVKKVLNSSVNVHTFHEVKSVEHDGERVQAVTIYDNRTQAELPLAIDQLILSLGFIANIGPLKEWCLEIEKGGVKVDSTMQTNIPGIFAAGDIARYVGKLNLISTGFGEAATAANYAKAHVDPSAKVFPGHSSEKEA
jgi:thioredoxin reductase (NADPH)